MNELPFLRCTNFLFYLAQVPHAFSTTLLEHFRFQSEKESLELLKEPKERSQVESELADCFFFILRFSQRFDVDLKAALLKKIDENGKKYPVDLSRGSNKKYNKLSKDL